MRLPDKMWFFLSPLVIFFVLSIAAALGAAALGYYKGNFFWILLLAVMFVPARLGQGLAIERSTGAHPMSFIIGSYVGGVALASVGYGVGLVLANIFE